MTIAITMLVDQDAYASQKGEGAERFQRSAPLNLPQLLKATYSNATVKVQATVVVVAP